MPVTLPHNITPTDPREIEPIMANFNTLADKFDGNIVTADIQDNAVTTAKIPNSGVTTAKIADENVTEPKIANAGVTTAKIADTAVTTNKITDAAVTTGKVANNAVTLPKLGTDLFGFTHTVSSTATASVTNNFNTFTNVGASMYTVTPTINCYLLISGYATILHSADTGTPTCSVGIRDTTANTMVLNGVRTTRPGDSDSVRWGFPVTGMIALNSGQTYTLSLAVSSSVSGTITLDTTTRVSAILIPR